MQRKISFKPKYMSWRNANLQTKKPTEAEIKKGTLIDDPSRPSSRYCFFTWNPTCSSASWSFNIFNCILTFTLFIKSSISHFLDSAEPLNLVLIAFDVTSSVPLNPYARSEMIYLLQHSDKTDNEIAQSNTWSSSCPSSCRSRCNDSTGWCSNVSLTNRLENVILLFEHHQKFHQTD